MVGRAQCGISLGMDENTLCWDFEQGEVQAGMRSEQNVCAANVCWDLSAEGDGAMVLFPQGQWVTWDGERGHSDCWGEGRWHSFSHLWMSQSKKLAQTSYPNLPNHHGLSTSTKQSTNSPRPQYTPPVSPLSTPASNGLAHLTWSTVVVAKRCTSAPTTPQRPSTYVPAGKIPVHFALSLPIGPTTEWKDLLAWTVAFQPHCDLTWGTRSRWYCSGKEGPHTLSHERDHEPPHVWGVEDWPGLGSDKKHLEQFDYFCEIRENEFIRTNSLLAPFLV